MSNVSATDVYLDGPYESPLIIRSRGQMKIAFLGVRVPGHLNPMTTLARKLKARGHDVVFLSMPDTEPFVRAAELPFIPFCENDFPVGSLAKSMAALSKL